MGGDESAVHVQRVVRGFLGRLAGEDMVTEMPERTGGGGISCSVRRKLGVCDYPFLLQCSQSGSDKVFVVVFVWLFTPLSRHLAALRQANLVYEKIFDPRTHAYYYYNTHTFETTWQVTT